MTDEDARAQVEAFLSIVKQRMGMSEEDFSELAKDIRWAHQMRRRLERMGEWAAKSIVTALAVGVSLALWEGFKALVTTRGTP